MSDGLPYCETCKGLRVVRIHAPTPGDRDFGRLVPCPDCGEEAQRQRRRELHRCHDARIQRYTMLKGRALRQTFDNFDLRNDEGFDTGPVRVALKASRAFATKPKGFLVLHGSRGTGKSHLAAAIANALKVSDEEPLLLVLFFIVPDLLDLLRSGYDEGDYGELIMLCKEVDVLILDDVGTEASKPWVEEKLFQIVNYRYNQMLPTVIATNCPLDELEPRLYSRLKEDRFGVVVDVTAPDYRLRRSQPGAII